MREKRDAFRVIFVILAFAQFMPPNPTDMRLFDAGVDEREEYISILFKVIIPA